MNKLIGLLMLISFSTTAQQVNGTPEFKDGRAAGNLAEKKMAKAPKKVFINQFRVNYQVLYADFDKSKATGNVGATSASLTVGFEGMEEKDFQMMTDAIYQEYVGMLKAKGFEIIDFSVAQGNKAYSKASALEGGKADYGYSKGWVSTVPTGYKYFLQSGKPVLAPRVKIGGVVADVNIYVPFMIDAESGASKLAGDALGGMSKVVASPSLRVAASSDHIYTWEVESIVKIPMKEDLVISGVFQDEKFKASALSQTNTSYNIGHLTRVYSQDVDTSKIQVAKGDPEKYKKGVKEGILTFLKHSSNVFFGFATE